MGAIDKPLNDAILKHALDVTRVEASLRLKVMKRMLRLQRELVALVNVDPPKTKAATDALLRSANRLIAKAYDDVHALLHPALTTIAKTQAQSIVKAIGRA